MELPSTLFWDCESMEIIIIVLKNNIYKNWIKILPTFLHKYIHKWNDFPKWIYKQMNAFYAPMLIKKQTLVYHTIHPKVKHISKGTQMQKFNFCFTTRYNIASKEAQQFLWRSSRGTIFRPRLLCLENIFPTPGFNHCSFFFRSLVE